MSSQKHHQDCDCCDGTKAITPLETINRPGLDQIQYRIGTHPTFFETMKARLSTKYIEQPFQSITAWELTVDDVRNPSRFVRRLQKGGDPISSYLRSILKPEVNTDCKKDKETEESKPKVESFDESQLDQAMQEDGNPEHTQQEIYCWMKTYDGTAVDASHIDSLAHYLNEILRNDLGFHGSNQISHLQISPTLRNLLNETSKSILQINRLILDLAYPDLIIPKLRLYPLNDLTTRQSNDPSIAMLDAWSTVADVLTFYQERFANEGYLPTATERRSVLELANLVGYKLRPGVSASTFLAFDVEKGHELIIPKGTRAQSIPGPGELPQSFETSQDFYAKDIWSKMKPRTTDPQLLNENRSVIYLSGIHSNLKPNMPLLIVPVPVGNEQAFFRRLKGLRIDAKNQKTMLTLSGELELEKLINLQNRQDFPIKVNEIDERIKPARVERESVSPNIEGAISISWFLLSKDKFSGSVSYNIKILEISDNGASGKIVDEFDNIEVEKITPLQIERFNIVSPNVNFDQQYYIAIDAVDHLNVSRFRSNPKGRDVRNEPDFTPILKSYVIEKLNDRNQNKNVNISPILVLDKIFPSIDISQFTKVELIIKKKEGDVESILNIPIEENEYTITSPLQYGSNYQIKATYQKIIDGKPVDDEESSTWDFSTTFGIVEKSEIPNFIWSDNSQKYLYITRNLHEKGSQSWDLKEEKELNPINSGAIIKFVLPDLSTSFQPSVPILDSIGRYFWKLSDKDLETDVITIDDIKNGDWLFFDIQREDLKISPRKNNLDVPTPINFEWDRLDGKHYKVDAEKYNSEGEYVPVPLETQSNESNPLFTIEGSFLENGTRYRWRVKEMPAIQDGEDSGDSQNSTPIAISPWWGFTTAGATQQDEYRAEIVNNVLSCLYQRIFETPSISTKSEPFDPLVEPLISFLLDEQSTKDQLERLIELQIPAIQRARGLMISLFAPKSDIDSAEIIYQNYPYTNYPFNRPAKWVMDLEKILVEIETQLQLIPIRSSLEDLPYNDLKFKPSKLGELESFIESIINSHVWEILGDQDKEKFLNGDPLLGSDNTNGSYPNGLLDLIADLKVEEPNESLKKEKDIIKITKIEAQRRRISDFRAAVFAVECTLATECDPTETPAGETITPLTWWLDNLLELLSEFTDPPSEEDEDENKEDQSLLLQLQKPPSVQILKRSIEDVVSNKQSNFSTQLLTTFVPKLKGLYYKALSAKELSIDLQRQGVYVFQVQAALFGAVSPENKVEYKEDGQDKSITFVPNIIGELLMELDDDEILLDGEYKEILKKEDGWIVIEQYREDNSTHRKAYKIKNVFTLSKPGFGKVTGLKIEDPQNSGISWQEEFQLFNDSSNSSLSFPDVLELWRLMYTHDSNTNRYIFDGISSEEFAKLREIATKTISLDNYRRIVIYAQNEPLPMARQPDERAVSGDTVDLDGLYDGFHPGRPIIISGERADIKDTVGLQASEIGIIASVQEIKVLNNALGIAVDRTFSSLKLANQLAYSYVRDTVTIHANVIEATHGETRTEILGNGDATQANQTFLLKQKPLTHVAAPTSSGVDSELTVYVNDVAWDETKNLVFLDKEERGLMTKIDNEDNVSVIFGDGHRGARLPTGVENVRAVYRSGIGKAGNVGAEQISMLATKPLGVKGVINPLAATGGVDRESLSQARKNAPIPLFALDRLVSLKDYEDFTRAFAGVAKAKVAQVDFGDSALIHLTVALVDDVPFDATSALYHNMVASLNQFGTLNMPLQVDKRSLSLIIASININIQAGYIWEKVETAVRQEILYNFGFDNRALGQSVLKSELLTVIQTVPGVQFADVDLLATISETGEVKPSDEITSGGTNEEDIVDVLQKAIEKLGSVELEDRIEMRAYPQLVDNEILPAEIAYFSPEIPDALILKEVRS